MGAVEGVKVGTSLGKSDDTLLGTTDGPTEGTILSLG